MDSEKIPFYIFIAIFSGWIGFKAYQRSEIAGVLILIGAVSWILYQVSSIEGVWNLFSMMIDPFRMLFISAIIAISYFTWIGQPFKESIIFGVGIALLGSAIAMWLYKYWDMG
ncbi:MAG: hypothetical protein ABEI78_02015 [Candidatus Nanohaloarchaea archaeon]